MLINDEQILVTQYNTEKFVEVACLLILDQFRRIAILGNKFTMLQSYSIYKYIFVMVYFVIFDGEIKIIMYDLQQ